jgi:hypothetical protein
MTRNVDVKALRNNLIEQGQYLLNAGLEEKIDPTLVLDRGNSDGSKASHYNPFQKKQ